MERPYFSALQSNSHGIKGWRAALGHSLGRISARSRYFGGHWVCGAVVGFLAMASACHAENTMTLVTNGTPSATIVLAAKPTRAAQFAAAELQNHIHKITTAKLPIVTDAESVTGARILVGESAATRVLGLRSSDFDSQEYLIQVRPDTIILMGRDLEDFRPMDYSDPATFPWLFEERGSSYAVYDFLERFCDVRWYLPTDLGTVYPQTKTLTVTGEDVRRSPAMKYRYWRLEYLMPEALHGDSIRGESLPPRLSMRESRLWFHRQRVGGEPYESNHSFYGYVDRFYDEHPDWFAQGYSGEPPQMCYTNPQFIEQVVQDARDYFDGKGLARQARADGDYYALVPMDNGSWCKCERCRSEILSEPQRGKGQFSNDLASDYVFGFINKIARELRKSHPDKFLSALAYHEYAFPPTREKLEPNVSIQLCFHARNLYNEALQENDLRMLRVWASESPQRRKFLWLYYNFPSENALAGQWRCFPGFFASQIPAQMQAYRDADVRGISWQYSYVAPYLSNPLMDQVEAYVALKITDDPSRNGTQIIDELFSRYYGAASEPLKAFYHLIEQAYRDPQNYPDGFTGHQTEAIAWGRLGTAARMAELARLMEQAQDAAQTDIEKQRVALFEAGIWQYMLKGRAAYLDKEQRKPQTMQSMRVPRVPKANGDPQLVDWSRSGAVSHWLTLLGEPTTRRVGGRIAHDGDFLYVRLEEHLDTTKLVITGRDDVWSEDEWELYIAGQRARPYRQLGVNARGVCISLAFDKAMTTWDSGVVALSDTTSPEVWTTSLALPFEKLLPGIEAGDTFYMNILRSTESTAARALAWVPTFAGYHEPSRFGEVHLEP